VICDSSVKEGQFTGGAGFFNIFSDRLCDPPSLLSKDYWGLERYTNSLSQFSREVREDSTAMPPTCLHGEALRYMVRVAQLS